jgi:hypothetical protein
MNIQARSGNSYPSGLPGGAAWRGPRNGPHLSATRAANGSATLARLGSEGRTEPEVAPPQMIGSLLIASSGGFIGCVAALLVEASVWQSLAVYSLTGTIIFLFLLIVRLGLKTAD